MSLTTGNYISSDTVYNATLGMDQLYYEFVAVLVKKLRTHEDDLMHAAVGISGEAGELLDAVKKSWVYGKELDHGNVVEELGDLFFYMTAMMILTDIRFQDVLQHNTNKLMKRYPTGYTDAAAIARADKITPETGE